MNKERYIELLKSTERKGINQLCLYLEQATDFFTAPASSRYHNNRKEGLVDHSLNVYDRLNENTTNTTLEQLKVDKNTVILVSLLHDICKANTYIVKKRNNQRADGTWEKVDYYTIEDQLPLGHGEKSVMIAQKFIRLSTEEISAIRWHMGFSGTKEDYGTLSQAIKYYPLIIAMMNADIESSYLLEEVA